MTVKESFDKFIYAKRLQGLSDKSIKDYRQIIGFVVRFLGEDTDIQDITRNKIDTYIEYQLDRNLTRSTFATYIRNAKIFLMWLESKYGLNFSASEIVTPKSPKTTPYIYSSADIALIFDNITSDIEWLALRNKAMVAIMLDSGIRQEEVCNLKLSDIDFHTNIIKIHGKGNKERLVPLGNLTKRFIQDYLNVCPYQSKHIFISLYGEDITTNALKIIARKISDKLPFEFSCHKLRHNFATNYCLDQYEQYGKIDIYSLMVIMGHENIKTTERYMHIATQILASRQNISHLDKILA